MTAGSGDIVPFGQRESSPIQPHNLDAEQELLGAILCNNAALDRVRSLKADHFFHDAHRRIFEACTYMIDRGNVANPVTLKAHFEKDEVIAKVGGVAYLARLAAAATTVINAPDYAKVITDLALRRALMAIGERIALQAQAPQVDDSGEQILIAAEADLTALRDGTVRAESRGVSLRDAMRAANEQADSARKGVRVGLATGIPELDEILSGMCPGDLIILAGRPSMGKSAAGQAISFNVAISDTPENPQGVCCFQGEMSSTQMGSRGVAWASGVPYNAMRRGEVDDTQFQKMTMAVSRAERLHYHIFAEPYLTIPMMRQRMRWLKQRQPVTMILADYLQIFKSMHDYGGSKPAQIAEISQGLKQLGMEFGVPVLALSQLSRAVDAREDKRPHLGDLKESGAIEQDADTVLFMFREEYYLERIEPTEGTPQHAEWADKIMPVRGLAEIGVAKQRMGPIGRCLVGFDGARNRIYSPGLGSSQRQAALDLTPPQEA